MGVWWGEVRRPDGLAVEVVHSLVSHAFDAALDLSGTEPSAGFYLDFTKASIPCCGFQPVTHQVTVTKDKTSSYNE